MRYTVPPRSLRVAYPFPCAPEAPGAGRASPSRAARFAPRFVYVPQRTSFRKAERDNRRSPSRLSSSEAAPLTPDSILCRSTPERALDGVRPYALGWPRNRQPLGGWPRLLLLGDRHPSIKLGQSHKPQTLPSEKGFVIESQAGMTSTVHARLRPNYVQIQGCCSATRPREQRPLPACFDATPCDLIGQPAWVLCWRGTRDPNR